jgi:chemotaxis protein histidine kinase CheA
VAALARNSQLAITPTVTDMVLESVDYLKRAMGQLEAVLAGGPPEPFQDNRALLERIRRAATEVSGRGVGMDVVRRQIQKLRGRVEVQSQMGRGTTFLL